MADTKDRKLAGPVTVGTRTYQPGDDLPEDVVAQIRNPKAWATDAEEEAAAAAAGPKPGGTASGARLAGNITVNGRTYTPGDEIPDDVAEQIRNPKAWEGGQLPELTSGPGFGSADTPAEPAPEPEPQPESDGEPEQKSRRTGSRRA